MRPATSTSLPDDFPLPCPLNASHDRLLIYRICNLNDQQAFEDLFHLYHPLLCDHVISIIHCRHRAEEIVSDVFLKIWNNRHQLFINNSLKSYLYRAVRNQAIDYLRRQVKRRTLEKEMQNQTIPFQEGSPEDIFINREVTQIVENAIDALPPQGRHIFRLSRDRGLKYREIAEMLDISVKTVETHMRRSLIFLRKELKGQLAY